MKSEKPGILIRLILLATALCAAAPIRPALADWKEPPDKKISEDQVKTYLAATNDWLDAYAEILQELGSSKTEQERMAALGDIDKKREATIAKYHLVPAEYDWIGQRVMEAWGVAVYMDDVYAKSQADLQKRFEENDRSKEDSDAAVKSAKQDQQAANDGAKQHADEAKSATDEADRRDSEAAAADKLAANPPANVAPADRQDYIDGKKAEAQSARDAAKEARDRAAQANKDLAGAQAKASAAGKRAEHPDIPVSDDEKAAMKSENDAAIAKSQAEINAIEKASTQMKSTEAQLKKTADDYAKTAPPENVAIMRKYADEYKKMFERQARGGATQPADK
jgi:hypothetical protein